MSNFIEEQQEKANNMSREDLARDIFKSIKPLIDFTLYDEELETQIELNYDGKFYRVVAGYIQDNYISKADHEAEIKKARVETKETIEKYFKDNYPADYTLTAGYVLCVLDEIISANTEGE